MWGFPVRPLANPRFFGFLARFVGACAAKAAIGAPGESGGYGQEGRRDRARGHDHRVIAQCNVPGGVRQRAQSARAHQRQDADALHPDPSGRSSGSRAFAL